MKTTIKNNKATRGFTLVEMIGVLAVIAILAGMLIPKIFEAIRNSRINAAIETYNTLKTAVAEHYAKWGKFAYAFTDANISAPDIAYTGTSFDSILLREGRIDGKAEDKIALSPGAGNAYVEVLIGKGGYGSTPIGYDLDGDGNSDTKPTSIVVQLVLKNVAGREAYELSSRLDGPALSTSDTTADNKGRVEYGAPSSGVTDVYMYITHL